jgi:hypothetical protein
LNNYNIDIKFINASNWQELTWYNSGGTRAKKVLQDANGNEYYFKRSEKKPAKDGKPEKHYKYEFWNEIIAYQLGKCLGLDILRYDVAIFDGEIGCISPLMIIPDEEQLLDIGRFMTALNPNFLPEDNATRSEYTFQLLEQTLDYFKISKYWEFIFQTILFDAIISNTDRHQENWAFIGKNTLLTHSLTQVEKEVKDKGFEKLNRLTKWAFKKIFDRKKNQLNATGKQMILETINIATTAPIFDSGSSMARELTDNRIELLLSNEVELNKYIENGKAELHWKGKKVSHYNLIEELLNSSYLGEVKNASKFLQEWQHNLISTILDSTETVVPVEWKSYCIPDNRKKVIAKLIPLRFQRLNKLIK